MRLRIRSTVVVLAGLMAVLLGGLLQLPAAAEQTGQLPAAAAPPITPPGPPTSPPGPPTSPPGPPTSPPGPPTSPPGPPTTPPGPTTNPPTESAPPPLRPGLQPPAPPRLVPLRPVPQQPVPQQPPSTRLAETGTPVVAMAGLGGLLMLAGTLMLALTARQRRRPPIEPTAE